VIYYVRMLRLPVKFVQRIARFLFAADANRLLLRGEKGNVPILAKEGVVLRVLPVLISTGIFQLVIILCVGASKK